MAILVGRNEDEQQSMQWFIDDWKNALLSFDEKLGIHVWPDIPNANEVDFVLVWNHPLGSLKKFSHAKAIYSLAAGVDHIFVDTELNHLIPIVRIVDPYMATDIVQYVTAYVLKYIKRIDHWAAKQRQKIWSKQPPFSFLDKTIGIMGLGHLGCKAATTLHHLGLKVNGWSQSYKDISGITQFVGDKQFNDFLTQTHILICMLPLTPQTKNILNKKTFSMLPKQAYLINVGRGQHLVEEDLLSALSSGQLSGACLDVFNQEPLPSQHPFWSHTQIHVTPHIASVTNAATAAKQLYENYLRVKNGQELLHQVNINKGY